MCFTGEKEERGEKGEKKERKIVRNDTKIRNTKYKI